MKYIRKAIAIILVVVFLAALAVGLSVIFAVRNINVLRIDYVTESSSETDDFSEAAEAVESALTSLKGKSILFVDESDVTGLLAADGYAEYVSFEKIYPCTINVTIRERLEVFSVMSEDGLSCSVYDSDMSYIATKESNENNLDGAPNVLVNVEDATAENYAAVAGAAAVISSREGLSAIRSFVESMSITVNQYEEQWNTLDIVLRCGLTMSIMDYTVNTEEKMAALLDEFFDLEDYEKLSGTLTCIQTESGGYYVDFVA